MQNSIAESLHIVWLLYIYVQAGYAAGFTPNPTYKEVCSGGTGHNEVVRVVFDPKKTSYAEMLKVS
jgi:peptide methionine sulfoxide reductase MsrA